MTETADTAYIAYGKGRIPLRMDPARARWHLITPRSEPPLETPEDEFHLAASKPAGSPPLSKLAGPGDQIVIVTSDGTRPVPNKTLIPWIVKELGAPPENITILLGTGSHRPNTPEEIAAMMGGDVTGRLRIVNHNAFDPNQNCAVGKAHPIGDVALAREYVDANKRIVVGFIEPHFFAGYSGGAKGIVPGIASIDTILNLHSFGIIGHPNSSYGIIDNNPTQEAIRAAVALRPPDFMVNVTLNSEKQITGFYLGHYIEAHLKGCEHVKTTAMAAVPHRFPVVITSNSGFPLDQNLYQSVKALSVAARIVENGGRIFLVSECSDGLPAHGNFGQYFNKGLKSAELLEWIRKQPKPGLDQWQAQTLANVLLKANVSVYSHLSPEQAERCAMTPVSDLQKAVDKHLDGYNGDVCAAVLPDGPLTIPYLAA